LDDSRESFSPLDFGERDRLREGGEGGEGDLADLFRLGERERSYSLSSLDIGERDRLREGGEGGEGDLPLGESFSFNSLPSGAILKSLALSSVSFCLSFPTCQLLVCRNVIAAESGLVCLLAL